MSFFELFHIRKRFTGSDTVRIVTGVCIFLAVLFLTGTASAKTFYLDGLLPQNCLIGNYSAANRSCTGSDGNAYNNIQDALNNLAGGDTLYVRSGSYYRTTNNHGEGAIHVNQSGTAAQHTVVRNYQGEQPVIYTAVGKNQYNPNPDDCWGTQGGLYYPNPAVSIWGSYIDVRGFKTYGQVHMNGHDISIQDSDLGGGGPAVNQGQVVSIGGIGAGVSYNVLIKNNKIHHSTCGESPANGAAVMGYNFSATIENNEFYDNYGPDIRLKDTTGQLGRATVIRNNFFRPSALRANSGYEGIAQDGELDHVYLYNNIFYKKNKGIDWGIAALIKTVAYNNTFIDCNSDITGWIDMPMYLYNNIFYHSSGQKFYDLESSVNIASITGNYNLFFSPPINTNWRHGASYTSALNAWQSYSGKDAASVVKDPGFVNSAGSAPADFKRTSYSGDVSGSTYGPVAGAYITGNEIIGLISTTGGTADTTPPSRPLALSIN